ncbi:amidohydrolase family protein [uncultured Pseudosulfitobacter sp.]|jgi:predicted TIM-barrel fold metal-dependent hydrolase|uniref:amidohydrolase family protein n=1 Tax=uncultured Pseudosulfitobacter sp. TaxID=2854214 RepID=UPI0030D85EAA|tara:strand:- start:7918 stop:8766 length:849 start_codon:yes stop_codon:yes gene_type:complete
MIIDFGATPPIETLSLGDGSHLANYRRVYASSEKASARGQTTLDQWFANVDAAGIDLTVIKARDVETTFGGRVTNEAVAEVVAAHPGRFLGFAGVDPNKGMTAVRELEYAVRELGLKGLNLQCFENQLAIDDRRMYPLYAKCVELDIPVNIHVGINFSLKSSPDFGRPEMLDRVLCDFPELRAIASPPGWPWVQELLAVAWRQPNLWIGLVAMRPRLMAVEHSGYGPLMQYGRTVLKDRMIVGTAWPMQPMDRVLDEVRQLPIEDDIAARWLGGNARTFLQL